MTKFLIFFQNCLVAMFISGFVFISVYVPQPINKVPAAEASGWPVVDVLAGILQTIGNLYHAATSALMNNLYLKEYVLDPLLFALVKSILQEITANIVRWVNSGFDGSPAYIQDLKAHLFNIADQEIGYYLEEIVGPDSIICSPFQLDIQMALAQSFDETLHGEPRGGACTLTGALENIDDFISGDFSAGGWEAWFRIVNEPQIYTPYGSYLEAEQQGLARIEDAQRRANSELGWGKGFMSSKECEEPASTGGRPICRIVTPGDTIAESLNFHLTGGSRVLIEADEIDEIIGALFAQLAQRVITGAGGLFSVSSEDGDGYLDEMGTEGLSLDNIRESANASLVRERAFLVDARAWAITLGAFATNTANSLESRTRALNESNFINTQLIPRIEANITELTAILEMIDSAPDNPPASLIQSIVRRYTALQSRLHSTERIQEFITRWQYMLLP